MIKGNDKHKEAIRYYLASISYAGKLVGDILDG